jgi:hypothetical protein
LHPLSPSLISTAIKARNHRRSSQEAGERKTSGFVPAEFDEGWLQRCSITADPATKEAVESNLEKWPLCRLGTFSARTILPWFCCACLSISHSTRQYETNFDFPRTAEEDHRDTRKWLNRQTHQFVRYRIKTH